MVTNVKAILLHFFSRRRPLFEDGRHMVRCRVQRPQAPLIPIVSHQWTTTTTRVAPPPHLVQALPPRWPPTTKSPAALPRLGKACLSCAREGGARLHQI